MVQKAKIKMINLKIQTWLKFTKLFGRDFLAKKDKKPNNPFLKLNLLKDPEVE